MDNTQYCETKLKDLMEELMLDLSRKRPADIINYSMEWLMKKGDITSNGLTKKERDELVSLRRDLKKYREIQAKNNDSDGSVEDDDQSDEEDQIIQEKINKKQSVRNPRIAVSAEVYGEFNKKGDYKAVVHPKSEDQVVAIKSRLIHSFMFSYLEPNDMKIIIDAMEYLKFSKGNVIINQGDQGDCLYIVEQGELDCYKKFVSFLFL
jgi:cAMP-dependent protein kinase regulator